MSTYNWMKNISININHYIHPPFLLRWYFINNIYCLLLIVFKLTKYTCKFISCFLFLLRLSFFLSQSHQWEICLQFHQFKIFARIYPEALASFEEDVFDSLCFILFKSIQIQPCLVIGWKFPVVMSDTYGGIQYSVATFRKKDKSVVIVTSQIDRSNKNTSILWVAETVCQDLRPLLKPR